MKLTVRRIGNSFGVIVPKAALRQWGVAEGGSLELTAQGIRPHRRVRGAHQALDALKRAIAFEVAARYGADDIRIRSAANLDRWRRSGVWCRAYGEWRAIVSSHDDGRLYAAMLGQDERANRLRQSMPFVGMLPGSVLERLREEAAR
jgi:antitoxin component of MazEF toxin-antitoxin module